MDKKRLLILTSTFPQREDDIVSARFVFDLAQALTEYYQVHVLSPAAFGSKSYEVMDNVIVHRFYYFFPKRMQGLTTGDGILSNMKHNRLLWFQVPFFFLSEVVSLIRVVKSHHIDIVNTHWMIPQAFVVAILKGLLNVKHILTEHAAAIFTLRRMGAVGKSLARYIVKRSDHVIAVSSYIKKVIDELVRYDYSYSIIHMGVNLKNFNMEKRRNELVKGPKKDNIFRLLFVGKIVQKKGLVYLIKAISILKGKSFNVRLDVVGGGPLEDSLKEYAVGLNLQETVVFHGWVANDKLAEFYGRCDIAVVPSILDSKKETEGMPVVVLEAMAIGRPVLASNISGIPDVVEDGYNGWLVEPKNIEALVLKIEEISSMSLNKYGENALYTALKFGCKTIAAKYKDVIESLDIKI